MADEFEISGHRFGRHVRSLRKARGYTQEALAKESGISADTIRRLENGSFSPSLRTLVSMSRGLKLRLSTILTSFEIGELPVERELMELMIGRDEEDLRLAVELLMVLFGRRDSGEG